MSNINGWYCLRRAVTALICKYYPEASITTDGTANLASEPRTFSSVYPDSDPNRIVKVGVMIFVEAQNVTAQNAFKIVEASNDYIDNILNLGIPLDGERLTAEDVNRYFGLAAIANF